MLNEMMLRNFLTAAKENANVVTIDNTEANGDDYYIKPFESVIIVNNSSSYTQNLVLPSAVENPGMMIFVQVPDFGGGGTITDRPGESFSTLTYDADGEYAVIYNTGREWLTLTTTM